MNKQTPTTIGVITDVHGNLPALVAILSEFNRLGVKQIIHTGDVVDIGMHSKECLQLLINSNCQLILGNHDFAFFNDYAKHQPYSHVTAQHKRYVFDSLQGLQHTQSLFKKQIDLQVYGVKFVFTHYAFRKQPLETGYLWQEIDHGATAEKLDQMFDYLDCDAVFFGHKHEPSDSVGKRVYVDVGSVGCHQQSVARGVVITVNPNGTWHYDRISVPYDRQAFKQQMLASNLPNVADIFDYYFDKPFLQE